MMGTCLAATTTIPPSRRTSARPPYRPLAILNLGSVPTTSAMRSGADLSSPGIAAVKPPRSKKPSLSQQSLQFTPFPPPVQSHLPSSERVTPVSQTQEGVGKTSSHQHSQGPQPRTRTRSSASLASYEGDLHTTNPRRSRSRGSKAPSSAPSTPLLQSRGLYRHQDQGEVGDYFTPSATPKVYPAKSAPSSPSSRSRSIRQSTSPPTSRPLTPHLRSSSHPHLFNGFYPTPFTSTLTESGSSRSLDMALTHATYAPTMVYASPPPPIDTLGLYNYNHTHGQGSRQLSRRASIDSDCDDDAVTFDTSRSRKSSRRGSGLRSRSSMTEIPPLEPLRMEGMQYRSNTRVSPLVNDTETEDDLSRALPTSRRVASPSPAPLSKLLIFRWLSVIPPLTAAWLHFHRLINPPLPAISKVTRAEYAVCVLWTLLSAYQNLSIATGLLHRWRYYYTLLPTIIRLLALQAICWPATHYTLRIFDHTQRPLVCWSLIGTTACLSKAIQMWATSNLRGGIDDLKTRSRPSSPAPSRQNSFSLDGGVRDPSTPTSVWMDAALGVAAEWAEGALAVMTASTNSENAPEQDCDGRPRTTGSTRPRRWDWSKVTRKCIAPAATIYFIMAWVLLLKQEFAGTTGC